MTPLSEHVGMQLESENWDTVARMALSFQIEFEKEDKHTAKLKKEMTLLKHILYENMKTPEMAEKYLNAAFFVRMHQTLARLEKSFDRNNLERTEFIVFLHALMHKLRREKLIVYKQLERKNEFTRMKDLGLL